MGGFEHPPGGVVYVYRDVPVVGVYGSDQLPFDIIVVFHHYVFVGGAVSRRMFKNPNLRCIEVSFSELSWKLHTYLIDWTPLGNTSVSSFDTMEFPSSESLKTKYLNL